MMTEASKEKGVVLIVDDESEIREILAIYADSCGYDVIEADDGDSALEMIRTLSIDVVISDVMMPRMSGMMLLRALREEGYDVPCIFVSAYPSKEATIEALRLGAFDFIEKPFESSDIIRLIHEAMRFSKEKNNVVCGRTNQEEEAGIGEAGIGESGTKVNTRPQEIEKQILALRSLRYQGSPADEAAKNTRIDDRLLEMFVSEALPQLVFCEASVSGLVDVDARNWELGYLFRVMQGLSAAAGSIGLTQVETFTAALERCFTVFRVRPGMMDDNHIELMTAAIDVAREMVSTIGSSFNLGEESITIESLVHDLDSELTATLTREAC